MTDQAAGSSRVVPHRRVDKFGEIYATVDGTREVLVGVRVDPLPAQGPYVAFLTWADDDAFSVAADRALAPYRTPAQRLLVQIFGKVELEPELKCYVAHAEGGRVIVVDLDEHYPGCQLHVPVSLVG